MLRRTNSFLEFAGRVLARVDRFIERYRVRLTVPVILALFLKDLLIGTRPHDVLDFANPFSLLGLAFVFAGLAVRSWAAGVLHKLNVLSTEGPYRLIRHPLYTGSFAIIVGVGLLIGAPENLVIFGLLTIVVYISQIKIEEGRLAERFHSDWAAYAARTGRFLPRRLTLGLAADWQFSQWLANREYKALGATLGGLALLKAWHALV